MHGCMPRAKALDNNKNTLYSLIQPIFLICYHNSTTTRPRAERIIVLKHKQSSPYIANIHSVDEFDPEINIRLYI